MRAKLLALVVLAALASACRGERTRGLDAMPDAPDFLDFGLIPVNGRKVVALPVRNTGALGLLMKGQDSRVDEPFELASVPGEALDPGLEATVLVAFSPVAPGEIEGALTLATSSEVQPRITVRLRGMAYLAEMVASPQRLDFGDVQVGQSKSLELIVTNPSPVALVPSVNRGAGPDYSVSPAGEQGSLQPKAATRVSVSFTPSVAGEAIGSVVISCPTCQDKLVELRGNGTQPPGPPPPPPVCNLVAQPERLDFGTLDPGQTASLTVELKSVGTGTCFVSQPYFDPSSDKSFTGTFGKLELAPNGGATLRVDWSPTSSTAASVAGTLVVVSNDKDRSPQSIAILGDVRPPPPPPPPPGKLEVIPASLAFTAQAPNAPPTQTLTVRNSGGTALTWIATESDSAMSLDVGNGSPAAGATQTVSVAVAAQSAAGARNTSIVVDAGTAGKVTVPVTITFTAAPPPPPPPAQLVVKPMALTFLAEVHQTPAAQAITVSNAGGQALTWSASSDDAKMTVAASTGTLQAGGAAVATVKVATQEFVGTRTQHIKVDAGAAGSATVTVTIEFKQTAPPPPPPQYAASVWPKFHHDNGNTGLSTIDTSGTVGQLRWKKFVSDPVGCKTLSTVWRCGTYQASPSLAADGSVYQVGGNGKLYALDRASGAVKWSTNVGVPMLASAESDITVVKSDHLFVHSHGEGADTPQFFKVDKAGAIVWKNAPAGYDANHKRLDGFDSAPAIDNDGDLYLMNEDASKVGRWDQRSVKLLDVYLDPRVGNAFTHGAALTTDKIAFWWGNGILYAVDEATGKVLWNHSDPIKANEDIYTYSKSAPMLTSDGKVISAFAWREGAGTTASPYKFYMRVNAFKAARTKTAVWSKTVGPIKATKGLAPRNANVNANEELRYGVGVSSPAMDLNGTIYVGGPDGLYALDRASGAVKWVYGMASVISSPAVGKDGTVYVGSMDGYIYAVKDKNLRWSYKTGGQVNSSPAIGADGTIYAISDDGYMYAVK